MAKVSLPLLGSHASQSDCTRLIALHGVDGLDWLILIRKVAGV